MEIFLEAAMLLALIAISAFFAAAEVAFLSISNVRMHALLERQAPGAKSLWRLRAKRRQVIIALLIGNNIANVAASVLATSITTTIFGEAGLGIAVGLMSFLLLTFGDIAPKSAATTYGDRLALLFAPIIEAFCLLISPLVALFEFINRLIPGVYARPTGIERFTEEEVRSAVNLGARHQSITIKEKELIENVLDFDKKTVEKAMTPRANVVSLLAQTTAQKALEIAIESQYSRFPVLDEQGHIIGIVGLRNIAKAARDNPSSQVKDIMISPLYFHPSERIDMAFYKMQRMGRNLAGVVDAQGKLIGIITLEDMLEELVGEIK